MPWFRVDDSFHTSRKVKSIPARQRFAAIGLWTIAGSWCSQELTDGHVPDYMIREWGATPKVVDSLVDSGLWERTRDGFAFCSWSDYNPTKSRVESDRAASKARMQASRKRRGDNTTGSEPDPVAVAPQQTRNTPHAVAVPRPGPARPDPLLSTVGIEGGGKQHARDEPPPPGCAQHPNGTTARCGACADARRRREQFDAELQAANLDEARRARAATIAVVQSEIADCTLCDDRGYRRGRVCDHDPAADQRNAAGMAKVRSILEAKQAKA